MSEYNESPNFHLHPSPLEYVNDSSLLPEQMSHLRILNGALLPFSIHISLDSIPFAAGVRPLSATGYSLWEPGSRSLSIYHGDTPSVLLYKEKLQISQSSFSTAVLTDSSCTGICVFHLTDLDCRGADGTKGYIRVFNGAMEDQSLSLAQLGSGLIWEQIPFGSATSYRTIQPGPHSFYVLSPSSQGPLSSLALTVRPGWGYTLYLAGNTWSPEGLQIIPAADGR